MGISRRFDNFIMKLLRANVSNLRDTAASRPMMYTQPCAIIIYRTKKYIFRCNLCGRIVLDLKRLNLLKTRRRMNILPAIFCHDLWGYPRSQTMHKLLGFGMTSRGTRDLCSYTCRVFRALPYTDRYATRRRLSGQTSTTTVRVRFVWFSIVVQTVRLLL